MFFLSYFQVERWSMRRAAPQRDPCPIANKSSTQPGRAMHYSYRKETNYPLCVFIV